VSSEPINTTAIQQFLKLVETTEKTNSREVKMPLQTAKTLATTLGIAMTRIAGNYEDLIRKQASTAPTSTNTSTDEVIKVELDGGNNW
jgi:hypothetical protein